jgi:hypothetical protein
VDAQDLRFPGSKLSQLESAHLWSFPPTAPPVGQVDPEAHTDLGRAVMGYYS